MALRKSQVLSYLREGGYSVVFLQETHMDLTAEDSWRLEWGDGVYFSHFMIQQAGMATLFSPNLRPELVGVTEAVPGHLLHLRVRMEGLVVNLVNIYAPTTSQKRLQFYQRVSDFLGTLDSHECLVLGGDFNTTLEEQGRSGAELSPAAANILQGIVEHHSLVDIWRDHHPDDTSTFIFVRVEAHRSHHSRLDRIYLSRFHLSQAHSSNIQLEDGAPLTDPVEMCGRARDFYTSLFSPDPTDPGACKVLWEELPVGRVGDRDRLELPFTLAKFSEALHRMPTNKSQGMDGLTVEFYRAFWDILGPDLATVWAESLQGGVLPLSCRRAVLALLPKKGDLHDLRNWRPISLLSTGYKIVAQAISLRLGS
ncbi:unnamed protein product [Caretta caretta]